MFFQISPILAFGTACLLTYAPAIEAGHAPHRHSPLFHRHHVRDLKPAAINLRAEPGAATVPANEIQLLQSETTAFEGWVNAWFASGNATDDGSAITQLQQQFSEYDQWMGSWLQQASGGATQDRVQQLHDKAAAFQSSVSSWLTANSASTTASIAQLQQEMQAYDGWINAFVNYALSLGGPATPPAPTSAALSVPIEPSQGTAVSSTQAAPPSSQAIQTPAETTLVVAVIPVPPSSPAPNSPSKPTTLVTVIAAPSASPSVAPAPVVSKPSEAAQPSAKPSNPPSQGSGGSFNAMSSSNLAVYYGQSGATSQVSLDKMCQDAAVDIVVLAFLDTFFGPGGFPSLNLGSACGGQTTQMKTVGAAGLLDCPTLASQITTCQGMGKKVLLSLGGAEATTAFSSDSQASSFATQLWNLFGGGGGADSALRPFGDVKIDGFDIGKHFRGASYPHLTLGFCRQRRSQHLFLQHLRILAAVVHD